MNPDHPATQRRLTLARKAIAIEPLSPVHIAEAAFISRRWVYPLIQYLHAQGEIHIERWDPTWSTGDHTPVYAAGAGPDARKPKPLTRRQKAARRRERLRANKPLYALALARRRGEADPLQMASVTKHRVTD